MVRVVDITGEDYLYPVAHFEEVTDLSALLTELSVGVTVPMKAALQEAASRRGVSVSALVREWLDEHLDLAVDVNQDHK